MKIVIIGSRGQVGSSLVNIAKTMGINVVALDRQALDITNSLQINDFFSSLGDCDFVINAAAFTAVDDAEQDQDSARAVNEVAIEYLANACRQFSIPFVHLSTDYVFDGRQSLPYDEQSIPNPQTVYGKTKLAGEKVLQKIWHQHIILRVSWVFSAVGRNFVKTMAKLLEQRSSINVVADQYGGPTSARSIAATVLSICQQLKAQPASHNLWGIYHYSDFPITSWHQLAEAIKKEREIMLGTKLQCVIEPIASYQYPTPAQRPMHSGLDTSKIQRVFALSQNYWLDELKGVMKAMKEAEQHV